MMTNHRAVQYAECMEQHTECMEQLEKFLALLMDVKTGVNEVGIRHYIRRLTSFLVLAEQMLLSLSEEYRYNEEIEVFLSCCYDHRHLLNDMQELTIACENYSTSHCYGKHKDLELFLSDLIRRLNSPVVRTRIYERKRLADDNRLNKANYVDGLFRLYPQLLVIRLDLYYKKEVQGSFKQFNDDVDRFFNHRRSNALFNHLVGHIVKFEYGLGRRSHAHLLLFFDNALLRCKGNDDSNLARDIGLYYWQNGITKGQGDYHNANDIQYKHNFQINDKLGIGFISASDLKMRKNLLTIVDYFCEDKQFLKPKNAPKMKLIRSGRLPVPRLNVA